MSMVRPPAAAGRFYPSDPDALRAEVERLLDQPTNADTSGSVGVVAPHAGYPYSGPVAGAAFAHIATASRPWSRVIVAGPAHFVPVPGVAVPTADAFRTPLGDMPVDRAAIELLAQQPGVVISDAAHAREHSIEVELPFVHATVGALPFLPLAVGSAGSNEVADVLEAAWDDDTLLVLSTDLSHYLPIEQARRRDRHTADAIVARRWEDIGESDACGRHALRGLVEVARRRNLEITEVALATSGDTAGPRDDVVGYGAFLVTGP